MKYPLQIFIWVFAIAGLMVACNTEPEVEHRIDLRLHDSLSIEAGKYDSLAITILDTNGGVIRAKAFTGPYSSVAHNGILKGIVLGPTAPEHFVIDIRAFKNGSEKVRVQVKVNGEVISPIVRVYTTPNPNPDTNTNRPTDTLPTGIDIAESELTLAERGESRRLTATLKPDTAKGQVVWNSSKESVAQVSNEGLVSPQDTGEAWVTASVAGLSQLKDSVRVRVVKVVALTSLRLQRPAPVLWLPGSSQRLQAIYEPADLIPVLNWKSSDSTTVRVGGDGVVTGLKSGQALITVTAAGVNPPSNILTDTLTVTVQANTPTLTVSPDQQVDVGQSASFTLKAVQPVGAPPTSALTLTWDFTGDGIPEGSATGDSALATHTYTVARSYEAVFTAQIENGEKAVVKRRIVVGKQGPLIVITSPKQDTTVNTVQFMVTYTSDGAPLSEVFELKSGLNTLWVKASNDLGKDSVSVRVTLDTIPPTPPTFNISKTTVSPTNLKRPTWVWQAGTGGVGIFRWSLNSTPPVNREDTAMAFTAPTDLPDGAYTLTVAERDAVGNWSKPALREIVIQTEGPLPPRVTASAVLTRTAPTFSWVGTGRTGARFQVRLFKGDATAPVDSLETSTLTYAPAATLFANADDVVFSVRVREQDALGNWGGDGTASARVDNMAPARPVISVQPPALVNAADTRTSLQWTWTRVGAATDSFVVTLNAVAQPKQAGTTFSLSTFTDGEYALQVVEVDAAGNASQATTATTVVVNRALPATPTPVVSESPTRDNTPTWTWSGPSGTQYAYRIARGGNPTGLDTATATTSFTPATALSDGVWYFQVRARNSAGNWSAWSASSICTIKAAAPLAPNVTRNAAVTNAPVWTWTSNGGGDGSYRYRWSGATGYLADGVSTSRYEPTTLTDNAYNLCVSERDVFGYGEERCMSITVDKTPPSITSYSVSDGFITNRASLSIGYSKDGVAGNYSCALVDQASKRCDTTVYDAAGNSATVTRTIWRRSNVVFARAGATGRGDGSSWVDAYPNAGDVLRPDRFFSSPSQLWIARGTYTPGNGQIYLYFRSNLAIYGGFAGTETDTSGRNLASNETIFVPVEATLYESMIRNEFRESDGTLRETADNFSISDITLNPGYATLKIVRATKAKLNRISVTNRNNLLTFMLFEDSKVLVENSNLLSNGTLSSVIYGTGSTVILSNTNISSNIGASAGVLVSNSVICANKATRITGNLVSAGGDEINVFAEEGGEFQYDNSVIIDANTILVSGGSSSGNSRRVSLCPEF